MLTRRHFLSRSASAGAVTFAGSAGILSALGNSKAHAADMTGYKALVCVFFFGGQDAHDTVLPFDQASYDRYAELRTGLLSDYAAQAGGSSRERARLRELTPVNAGDFGTRSFALPEALDPIKTLFDNGNAAIIGNVGPLVEPLNRQDYDEGVKAQPRRLFSHNDQQSTWMSSAPEGNTQGWGGRLTDPIQAQNQTFAAISTFGNTVFLSGENTQPYNLSTSGPPQVTGLRNAGRRLLGSASNNQAAIQRLEDQYRDIGAMRSNLFERDTSAITNRAFIANESLSNALDMAPDLSGNFPDSRLGGQLRSVAEAISIRGTLNMSRQVFFVGLGGFDTHDDQAADLTSLHAQYAQAIAAFHQTTIDFGIENDVTLFTASDFGRALIENGNGTDHGWGGHHFVVGGAVNGNRIYGDIPPYDVGHAQDAGNGRLIPNVAVEQYAATLGKWFGLSDQELLGALPALSNFPQRDLGFMATAMG